MENKYKVELPPELVTIRKDELQAILEKEISISTDEYKAFVKKEVLLDIFIDLIYQNVYINSRGKLDFSYEANQRISDFLAINFPAKHKEWFNTERGEVNNDN